MTSGSPVSGPAYIDPATGRTYSFDTPRWRSDDGGPLMITPLPGIGRADIDTGKRSLWRYAAALPLPIEKPISMGEGMTPLVRHAFRGGHAHFKLEWFAPMVEAIVDVSECHVEPRLLRANLLDLLDPFGLLATREIGAEL